MGDTTSEEIEDLARELFRAADPSGVFEWADYPVQAHFRRQAQQQLAAKRYTAESV